MCRNCLSQGSVFRQTSAFSSPTIQSLHRGAELQSPAVPSPGSGQRPQGRQCLRWGAAGRAVPTGCVPAWPCQGCCGKWLLSGHSGIPHAGLSIIGGADPLWLSQLSEPLQGATCQGSPGASLPCAPGQNPHCPLLLRRTWFTAMWWAEASLNSLLAWPLAALLHRHHTLLV